MSIWDDWDLWLGQAGVTDEPEMPRDSSGTEPLGTEPLEDPWGGIDIVLTPLSDAQREHLRLAAPTVLDELGAGDTTTLEPSTAVSEELAAAFEVLDDYADPDGPGDVTP